MVGSATTNDHGTSDPDDDTYDYTPTGGPTSQWTWDRALGGYVNGEEIIYIGDTETQDDYSWARCPVPEDPPFPEEPTEGGTLAD